MGMHEHDGIGKVIVMIDNVAEVYLRVELVEVQNACRDLICAYHSLTAFVLGDLVFRLGIIDLVDDQWRVWNLLLHPTYILLFCLGDDDFEGIVAAWRFGHAISELWYYAKVERIAFVDRRRNLGRLWIGIPS